MHSVATGKSAVSWAIKYIHESRSLQVRLQVPHLVCGEEGQYLLWLEGSKHLHSLQLSLNLLHLLNLKIMHQEKTCGSASNHPVQLSVCFKLTELPTARKQNVAAPFLAWLMQPQQ